MHDDRKASSRMVTRRSGTTLVLSNTKGGCGKSTIAVHLIVHLSKRGLSVGSLDLDGHQATLTKYLSNRWCHLATTGVTPPPMDHVVLNETGKPVSSTMEIDRAIARLQARHDVVVIDTPGSDCPATRQALVNADVLITPINDSLIDFDMLARLSPDTQAVTADGDFTRMVHAAFADRTDRGLPTPHWYVLRNRLSQIDSRNNRLLRAALAEAGDRIGCTVVAGLSERVIFRELFLNGQTLLDFGEGSGVEMNMSHVAARQELRTLFGALDLKAKSPALPVPAQADSGVGADDDGEDERVRRGALRLRTLLRKPRQTDCVQRA